MSYTLYFEEAALKDLARIDKPWRERIKKKLLLFAENPDVLKGAVKLLKGDAYRGLSRLRVGDYRVVFRKEDTRLIVVVVRVGHRKEIY